MYLVGGIMLNDLETKDEFARKIMGFSSDKYLEYDKVVERYAYLLELYAYRLPDKDFINIDNYENLNYSFNYCTGNLLEEYINIDLDTDSLVLKASENEHYNDILKGASKIVERLYYLGLDDMASQLGASFYVIANAVYDYEKSFEDIDIKTLS